MTLCDRCLSPKPIPGARCPACVAAYRQTDAYRMRNAAQKRLDRSRWTPEQKQASLQRLLDRKARGS